MGKLDMRPFVLKVDLGQDEMVSEGLPCRENNEQSPDSDLY